MPSTDRDNVATVPKSRGRKTTTATATSHATSLEASQPQADSEEGGVPLPQINAALATTSNSNRRRRPKKVGSQSKESLPSLADGNAVESRAVMSVEVEALKNKVQEIEAQVQEILLRPAAPKKSSRRRTKATKTQAQQLDKEKEEQEDGNGSEAVPDTAAREELDRLQRELLEAQGELSYLRQARQAAPIDLDEESDIEEVPRVQGPGLDVQQRPRPLGRSVTLSGSYRLPIPVNVSDADVDAIGRGIKSAQNIARSFLDHEAVRRRAEVTTERTVTKNESWGQWFGGYSMSIAKAVSGMQISDGSASIPQQKPIDQSRESVKLRRKPPKLEMRNKKRPDMATAGRTLSESQVAGLLA